MDTLKVSVIIPSYNYEQFISQCIESVLEQDYENIEIIVVDDCSTDDSRGLIKSYGDRIDYIFHAENMGHGGAFNTGFESSSGDIVMFLDADDFLLPGAISTIVKEYDPSYSIFPYFMKMVDESGVYFDQYPAANSGLDGGNVVKKLCRHGFYRCTVTSGMAFNRLALKNVLPMNHEDFRQGGDGYLAISAPFYGEIKIINDKLSAYRQHSANHSNFNANLLKRAKWCAEHNEKKFYYIREHANKTGYEVNDTIEQYCLPYLEQLMVIKLLSSDKIEPSRVNLSTKAIRCINYENIRWIMIGFWWLAIGFLPKKIASSILCWKLDPLSRPLVFRKVIRAFK